MKYNDSIPQADNKMVMSVKQLQLWRVAATPINYAVSYEYISRSNTPLIKAIKEHIKLNTKLDNFFIEECYRKFVMSQSSFREEMIDDMSQALNQIHFEAKKSSQSVDGLIQHIDQNIHDIKSENKAQSNLAAKKIYNASHIFKAQQKKLIQQLQVTQKNTQKLKQELEDVKKEIYLDSLTGLYNRKAMDKHIDAWISADPNQKIAAILINIDQFSQIKDRFGPLISDVLLSKIAHKVNSYVGDSGLPVRSSSDEFLILIPEIQRNIAKEIAEKIRQGVEKLRFISSKSGVRLPKMTISLAVNDFKVSDNVNQVVSSTRNLLEDVALDNYVSTYY